MSPSRQLTPHDVHGLRVRSASSPFNTGCAPLDYSGNPGVYGVYYRGSRYADETSASAYFPTELLSHPQITQQQLREVNKTNLEKVGGSCMLLGIACTARGLQWPERLFLNGFCGDGGGIQALRSIAGAAEMSGRRPSRQIRTLALLQGMFVCESSV